MNFQDKTVIITGGNAGIGAAAALKFAQANATVVILDIADNLAEDLAADLQQTAAKHLYIKCNVADETSVKAAYSQVIEQFGGFDVSVHNAGILGNRQRIDMYESDIFDAVIDVNVKGVFYCLKQATAHFIAAKKQGVIVNTASVAGHVGMGGYIAYSASKHAVVGMTKTAAAEYGRYGIRINALCPGFTETAMLKESEVDVRYRETLKQLTPLKRFAQPNEIADGILYLASDAASFMTGQSLILDGGLSSQ